jgi:hypothetical protein
VTLEPGDVFLMKPPTLILELLRGIIPGIKIDQKRAYC